VRPTRCLALRSALRIRSPKRPVSAPLASARSPASLNQLDVPRVSV
jgi:hypothetical protein